MSYLSVIVVVAAGGILGTWLRFKLAGVLNRAFSSPVPYGTLTVNLIGSFVIGWVMGSNAPLLLRNFVATGFCGALTTFSTLKLELLRLAQQRKWGSFAVYFLLTYVPGLLLVWAGYTAASGR
ncbi:fluoride efflux transporter FluC [Paenibacillus sp. y28]|uniref:fluoride efflux transporter FluC n=1 Tax=Paenibacillus sp. y28 TaxID=3129110 RepID=UPI0030195BDF